MFKRKVSRRLSSFLQVQEQLDGKWASQNGLLRRRFTLAQLAHVEDDWGWQRCQMYFAIQALFHSSNFLRPSPPSSLGEVTTSQATLVPWRSSPRPFQRKRLSIWSTSLMIRLGRMKTLDQWTWMLKRTDWINWSRPAKDSAFEVQLWILATMRSTRILQSVEESLVEMRGIPRYLTG